MKLVKSKSPFIIDDNTPATRNDWRKALTPEQAHTALKDVLKSQAPKIAVKSSAGTGKTEVLIIDNL